MSNKITLNKEEEVELTEREQLIYEQGKSDCNDEWWNDIFEFAFIFAVVAVFFLIVISLASR